ncbi:DUF58 domain-containing protein [Salinisphaera sp. T31B1]|uniref:DUF58 domain-containing protein n=1 Tax=Salinisphaera sp. T31B1 TaxID=727963 RepID=UPI003342D557
MALAYRLRQAQQRFIRRRTPAAVPPLAISRRRLYILPTRSGVLFAGLLVVMLLGATNYSNSLAFALTFWLASIALVSMHHAHRNLLGLELRAVDAEPVFAGTPAVFDITLAHQATRSRRAVQVSADRSRAGTPVDLGPRASARVQVDAGAARRGSMPCPRLRLESIYPIGLFRSWSWLTPQAQLLVYPRPAGRDRLPEPSATDSDPAAVACLGRGEVIGQRGYRRGDSPRDIDWKASARSDDTLVREYESEGRRRLWLDYEHLSWLDHEARLSQLTLWVTRAERQGLDYGLALPGTRIEPGHGPAHLRSCLHTLALA